METRAYDSEFDRFYREQWSLVVDSLVRLGAGHLAPDLAQDAMTAIYRRWTTVEHPRALVRAIAVRLWRDHDRHGCYRPLVTECSVSHCAVARIESATPLDHLLRREELLDLTSGLREHPPRQRQVIAYSMRGFRPSEIARELRISPAGVHLHLYRARRDLRSRLPW